MCAAKKDDKDLPKAVQGDLDAKSKPFDVWLEWSLNSPIDVLCIIKAVVQEKGKDEKVYRVTVYMGEKDGKAYPKEDITYTSPDKLCWDYPHLARFDPTANVYRMTQLDCTGADALSLPWRPKDLVLHL